MSITRVKEMFIIFINLSLRKRQISYRILDWLQILETKTTTKKKEKKKKKKKKATMKITSFLLQFFSLIAALVGRVSAASEASEPLLVWSPLAGIGKVARMISILVETSFCLERSCGATGGFVALRATLLDVFISFSMTPGYSATLEGLSGRGRTLVGLALPISATSKVVSVLELARADVRMAGG